MSSEFNTTGAETGRFRSDRQELEILRVSLARIAQAAGVETEKFPVLTKSSFNELCEFAKQDRGWNALAATVVDKLTDHAMIDQFETPDVIHALRQYAGDCYVGDGGYSDSLYDLSNRLESTAKERQWQ